MKLLRKDWLRRLEVRNRKGKRGWGGGGLLHVCHSILRTKKSNVSYKSLEKFPTDSDIRNLSVYVGAYFVG